jgi:hypothetical protein
VSTRPRAESGPALPPRLSAKDLRLGQPRLAILLAEENEGVTSLRSPTAENPQAATLLETSLHIRQALKDQRQGGSGVLDTPGPSKVGACLAWRSGSLDGRPQRERVMSHQLTARRQPGRSWPRALALLSSVVLALGVSAAQVPGPWHQDDAPHACPVCKLGYLPVPVALASTLVEPPAPPRLLALPRERPARLLNTRNQGPSRAPPA